jgi:hypothetical protein
MTMPEAQFSLGNTLDPHINEIVTELKELNWNAQKGVRYGIPYLRIKRTGFYHVIEFDRWEPHSLGLSNIPTHVIPLAQKYWCWSALEDKYNPNTTGHLFYNEKNYHFKLRGVICSLGSSFSKAEFLEAVFMILWDPCQIPNSITSLKPEILPDSVCPVCTPPQEYKKIIKDGQFPQYFRDSFLSLGESMKLERIRKRFQSSIDEENLSNPVELGGQLDRFQTESVVRKELREIALLKETSSNIPEHYLFRRLHNAGKLTVQNRTWIADASDPKVAHLGRDTNLGNLPYTNIPAIQTLCNEIWMTLPSVFDGDFGDREPCLVCIQKSFVENKLRQTSKNDLSWTKVNSSGEPKNGFFQNLEWGQPIMTPTKITSKKDWYISAIDSFGVYTLTLAQELNQTLNLQNEPTDQKLIIELLATRHPGHFNCLICEAEQSVSDLCEEFCTAGSSSKYKFLVSLESIVRLGPTVLCSDCRSLTYGTDYDNIGESNKALEALVAYKRITGVIPDNNWHSRPILKHLKQSLTLGEKDALTHEAVMLAMAMPSGYEVIPTKSSERKSWKVNPFSWWELLHRAGLVEKFKTSPRGKQGVSDDGHLCLSMLEWKFCNLLFASAIDHQKEPRYSSTNQTRADYLIGDLYIEIAGLLSDSDYALKLKSKLEAAKVRKQRVLVFTPRGIEDLMKFSKIDHATLEDIWRKDVRAGGLSCLAHS